MKNILSRDAKYLFNTGRNFYSYKMLGAHKLEHDGKQGFLFAVWAPNAQAVSVVCDSNGWDFYSAPMEKDEVSGIWSLFIPDIKNGERYKYCIKGKDGNIYLKTDPYGFYSEIRPDNASVVYDCMYEWQDEAWITGRIAPYNKPLNIYEVHFASWKQHENGEFFSYTEMADDLIPYVKRMGYSHIELMPICEFPFDGSWGYQVTGYYAANSRFGTPEQLKYFVDKCHRNNIGVIMDWVPAHFPKDAHALALFDGTHLYEHPDSRLGEHKEWGTYVFNWEKTEVYSFLISNAIFWLDEYHFDGLRVDAVSSMLYRDYNRRDGEWIANKFGGHENTEAIEFLQKLNIAVFERFPNALMIAEESTAWGGVTKPVHEGGLGFNFKWNMGWMNDILRYMSMDPFFRGPNHNMLTFSMMYAYAENYILALSHDEVVHGKRSLIDKMSGTYEQKFASLRLLYAYMYAHPGKKLLFMGDEFAQFIEWRYYEGLEWKLLEYENHAKMLEFSKELNNFYKTHKAMHENDSDWNGFEWINAEDASRNVVTFMRISKSRREKIIVAANFAAQSYEKYEVGVPSKGDYEVVLDTDLEVFGGKTSVKRIYKAKKKKYGKFPYTIEIDLPELSACYIKKQRAKKG